MLSPPPAHFLLGAEPGTVKRGLATLTGISQSLRARPEVAFRYWTGRVALRNRAPQHDLARSP
jgi:hypothetical protein